MRSGRRLKVCFYPGREAGYVRTRTIVECLRRMGVDLVDCSHPKRGPLRYLFSTWKFLFNYRKCDLILVGFCGNHLVYLVRLLTKQPLILDAFLSVYETLVYERRRLRPGSIAAKVLRHLERKSCLLADRVLLDTNAHIDYFVDALDLPYSLLRRLPASCGEIGLPDPEPRNSDPPLVHFHGEFQRLHGADTIVRAAALLPGIRFRLIGKGPEWKECRALAAELDLRNLEFLAPVSYDRLCGYIREADICLGIFGDTPKANMVIPNKVYEYLALAKPVVTRKSEAVEELFQDGSDMLLCAPADPGDLAEKIGVLLGDQDLRGRIARQGRKTFTATCSWDALADQLGRVISEVMGA